MAENILKMLVSDVLHIVLVHYSKNKTDYVLYSMSKTQTLSIPLNKPQSESELDYWTMIILSAYLLVPLLAQFWPGLTTSFRCTYGRELSKQVMWVRLQQIRVCTVL